MGETVYNVISSYSPLSQKRKCIQSSTYFISKPKTPGCATGTGASAGGSTGASAGGAGTGGAGAGGTGVGTGRAGAGGTGGAGAGGTGGRSAGDGGAGGAGDGAGTAASSSISCLMSSSGTQSLYRLYKLTLFYSPHHNYCLTNSLVHP